MSRKSLRTGALLLGLLLVTCSSAYADAIAITSVSVSNFQLIASSGTIVFSSPQTAASGAAANSFGEEEGDSSQGPTLSQASTSVTFAGASGVSDFTNLLLTANSNAMTRQTVMTNRLSMVKKSPEEKALMTIIARKPSAARMQRKFSRLSSLLIRISDALCRPASSARSFLHSRIVRIARLEKPLRDLPSPHKQRDSME